MVRARTARIASIALMLAIVVMVGTRSLVASGSATALVWERTWGGTEMEAGRGVATATDGMVYMAGYTDSFGMGFSDAFLAKYDASGTLLWNRTCGGTSTEFGCNVAIAADETIYLAGSTSSAGAGGLDAFLAKYNATGSQLWNRTWGGTSSDLGWGVAAADDGSVYLAGYTASFGAGDGDAFLVKFNATGSQLWNHTWGGLSEDDGAAVVVYSDMVYLTGYTWSFSAGWSDAFLAKFNSTGAQLWNRTWGGIQWDVAKGGAASMDGTINIAGATGSDAFLAKYDASGTLLWNRTWGGLGWAEGWGVAATTDGSLFLAGLTAPLEEDADAFLVKFSAAGDQLWSQTWGGAGEDHGLDVAAAAGGVIYVTGSTNSSGAGGYDAFLAKLTIVMPSPDYTWLVMLLIIGGAAVAIVLAIITVKKRRPASPAI